MFTWKSGHNYVTNGRDVSHYWDPTASKSMPITIVWPVGHLLTASSVQKCITLWSIPIAINVCIHFTIECYWTQRRTFETVISSLTTMTELSVGSDVWPTPILCSSDDRIPVQPESDCGQQRRLVWPQLFRMIQIAKWFSRSHHWVCFSDVSDKLVSKWSPLPWSKWFHLIPFHAIPFAVVLHSRIFCVTNAFNA